MAFTKVTISLPDIRAAYKVSGYDYSSPATKIENVDTLKQIFRKYSPVISKYGRAYDIPDGVIASFIATESSGQMVKPNRFKATGLMQVTPNALLETISKFKFVTGNAIPDVTTEKIKATVPELLTAKKMSSSLESKVLKYLQSDADFNVMAGTNTLRWLLERFSKDGVGQLNKAMVGYNAGAYLGVLSGGKDISPVVDSTSLAKNSRVPSESRAYLYKMLGKDGFLDLIYRQKLA